MQKPRIVTMKMAGEADGPVQGGRRNEAECYIDPNSDQMNQAEGEEQEMGDARFQGPGQYANLSEKDLGTVAAGLVHYCKNSNPQGAVWLMEGDLGAGKTTFVACAAQALGIQDIVNSPTFNLHNYYSGSEGDLNHFDLYRLGNAAMMELEFAEIWESPGPRFTIHAIEWWNRLPVIYSRLSFYRINILRTDDLHRTLSIIELKDKEVRP